MNARRTRHWATALGIVAILAVLAIPTGWAGVGTVNATAPQTSPAHAAAAPAAPRPAFGCPNPPLGYGLDGNYLPPSPIQAYQTCPGPIAQDTVHGIFSSSAPGSGERFTEPVYLPTGGSPGQPYAYNDFFVGMVVGGDPASAFRQSYAQLTFQPNDTGVNSTVYWSLSLQVWSLRNESASATACGSSAVSNMTLVWNNSFWCVGDEIGNGSGFAGPSGIAGNTWYNVTFDGGIDETTGLWVWANDSTDPLPANNISFQLSAANTGSFSFHPYYNSSCPDVCFLNWTIPVGLGLGWDICPFGVLVAACNSYNQTVWDGSPSVGFGIPEYWVNASAGYSGDYQVPSLRSPPARSAARRRWSRSPTVRTTTRVAEPGSTRGSPGTVPSSTSGTTGRTRSTISGASTPSTSRTVRSSTISCRRSSTRSTTTAGPAICARRSA